MKKLILHMIMSIDGFISDGRGQVNPAAQWDEEMQQFYLDVFTRAGAVVYGRGIFEQYFGHWVKVATGAIAAGTDVELRWTRRLAAMPKYVLSKKLTEVSGNASILRGNIVEEFTRLKREAPGDLLLMCGPSLFAQLTAQRLIDQYMLYVCPNALGQGTHLFRESPEHVKLKYERTVPFATGVNLQYYAPVYG